MSSPPLRNSPVRVLLVEDSLVNQKLLTGLLGRRVFTVTIAGNGQEALDQMDAHDFDIVLMDIQMPLMDGLTATRHIREREDGTGKHTPVLAITAGIDRESCLESGADGFLAKPVRKETLHELIRELLWQSEDTTRLSAAST